MKRARRHPKARIVRRTDALGRVYYAELASGQRRGKRDWILDVERRKRPLPKKPKPMAKEELAELLEEGGLPKGRKIEPIGGPGIAHEPDVTKHFPSGISSKGVPTKPPPVVPPELEEEEIDPSIFEVHGRIRTGGAR